MKVKAIVVINLMVIVFANFSCKKEPTTAPVQLFSWRIDGGAEIKGDSIVFIPIFNYWGAEKDSISIGFSITTIALGTYTQFSGTASVSYNVSGNLYYTAESRVSITNVANNLAKGTFNATIINSGVDTFYIAGRFENLGYL